MVQIDNLDSWRILSNVKARSTLIAQILSHKFEESLLYGICDKVLRGESRKNTLD